MCREHPPGQLQKPLTSCTAVLSHHAGTLPPATPDCRARGSDTRRPVDAHCRRLRQPWRLAPGRQQVHLPPDGATGRAHLGLSSPAGNSSTAAQQPAVTQDQSYYHWGQRKKTPELSTSTSVFLLSVTELCPETGV